MSILMWIGVFVAVFIGGIGVFLSYYFGGRKRNFITHSLTGIERPSY